MSATTLTLPDDIDVEIDYDVNEHDEVIFDSAYIGGKFLDSDKIFIDFTDSYGLLHVRDTLKNYFQSKLNEKAEELLQDYRDGCLEDLADLMEGR